MYAYTKLYYNENYDSMDIDNYDNYDNYDDYNNINNNNNNDVIILEKKNGIQETLNDKNVEKKYKLDNESSEPLIILLKNTLHLKIDFDTILALRKTCRDLYIAVELMIKNYRLIFGVPKIGITINPIKFDERENIRKVIKIFHEFKIKVSIDVFIQLYFNNYKQLKNLKSLVAMAY